MKNAVMRTIVSYTSEDLPLGFFGGHNKLEQDEKHLYTGINVLPDSYLSGWNHHMIRPGNK